MKKLIFILAASMVVSFLSCKKDSETPTPNTINDFFVQNGAPVQTFTINSGTFNSVNGAQGTKIYVYANSFVTQANQPITGNVIVELREIFSKKDMILSNAPTTSGGKPLISGGEIYLSAKQNEQKLKLASGSELYVMMPAGQNPSSQMKKFYASNLDENSDWNVADTTTAIQVIQDTSNNSNYYSFPVDSMNWINCDYFYSIPGPTSTIAVNVGSDFDTSNCFVFISFNGQNSAARCYAYSNHIFSPGSYYNLPSSYYTLPVGMNVTFVAIAKKNGQYYSAFKSSVITAAHSITLSLAATTESQIKHDLSVLP